MNPNIKQIYCKKNDKIMPTVHGERKLGELACNNIHCTSAVIINKDHTLCNGNNKPVLE